MTSNSIDRANTLCYAARQSQSTTISDTYGPEV